MISHEHCLSIMVAILKFHILYFRVEMPKKLNYDLNQWWMSWISYMLSQRCKDIEPCKWPRCIYEHWLNIKCLVTCILRCMLAATHSRASLHQYCVHKKEGIICCVEPWSPRIDLWDIHARYPLMNNNSRYTKSHYFKYWDGLDTKLAPSWMSTS